MILVTGFTGLIGGAVTKLLLQKGCRVRALIRPTENGFPEEEGLSFFKCDLLQMTEADAMSACDGISTVIHCAGLVHKPYADSNLYVQLNELPTKLLAHAARARNVSQFIFLSSSSVYGNRETNMISEDADCVPDSPYASSKINCEQILHDNQPCPSTIIVRPSMVFGEGDRGNMLSLIRQVLSGKYFLISQGTALKSLIYAADFAAAICLILGKKSPGIHTYNVANPQPVSMQELSLCILSAAGRSQKIPSIPESVLRPLSQIANAVLGEKSPLSKDRLDKLTRSNTISIERFCRDYGFAPQYELKESLANEIAWAQL